DQTTIGEAARAELFEMRCLALGQPFPEIAGEDLDGMKLKLSDHRGKVVLLAFWAHWSGPSVAMLGHERLLVKALEKKPFALIGVNADQSKEACKKQNERRQVCWRSFFDGREGPIAQRFNVRGWPTLFLIDAKGVLRYKWVGHPGVDVL